MKADSQHLTVQYPHSKTQCQTDKMSPALLSLKSGDFPHGHFKNVLKGHIYTREFDLNFKFSYRKSFQQEDHGAADT